LRKTYLILVFHLTWSIGIILMTHSSVVSLWLRWAITGVFIVLALVFGIIDKVTKDDGTRDATPFDKWTIVHTLAGVVFGAWYVPIIYVLILVFLWECFEFSVTGFGETEVILNRVVDMGVAVAGWLAVVFVVMAVEGSPFPLAAPVAAPKHDAAHRSDNMLRDGAGVQLATSRAGALGLCRCFSYS
jgi:hypothetical protein